MGFVVIRLLLTFTACAVLSSAVMLTDNLSNTTEGSEFVGGDTWIAAAFSTNNRRVTRSSASLLLGGYGAWIFRLGVPEHSRRSGGVPHAEKE
jgi:hypothetical protein